MSATSLSPAIGHADAPTSAQLSAARELFVKALDLEEKGDWAGALVLFQKVAAVRASAQVRFHLGLSLEHVGRRAEALDQFERALSMTVGQDDKDAKAVATKAATHAEQLRKVLPTLRVTAPAGARLAIDGTPVTSAIAESGVRLDPGVHTVTADADGHEVGTREVRLLESGVPMSISVDLGPAIASKSKRGKSKDGGETRPVASWLPWTTGALAVAAFGGAATFYVLRQSAMSDLDGACAAGRTMCPPSLRSTYDHGVTYSLAADVLLGVGIGAAALTTGYLVWSPREKVGLTASVGVGTISIGGIF